MTTFAFPSITPTTNTFELVANTRTFQSPLTNAVQTSSRKGSLWRASLQFSNLKGDDRQEMQAFLVKLNGQQHRFTLHDHSYTRRGAGGGTLSINGASQSGTALVCDGATANVNNYLRAGDYISFNNERTWLWLMLIQTHRATSPCRLHHLSERRQRTILLWITSHPSLGCLCLQAQRHGRRRQIYRQTLGLTLSRMF